MALGLKVPKIVSGSGSSGSTTPASGSASGINNNIDDIDEVDDQGQSILMSIISQLRPGCDLSRITLPTFILERKSMLERITNQLQQPDILLKAHDDFRDDPLQRFLLIIKWYMSGWHIAPKAVKKPLNPVLGEYFTAYWDLPESMLANEKKPQQAFYIAEQTEHHPPKSLYFYMIPQLHIRVDGTAIPKSRFLGNSTAAMMDGVSVLKFLDYKYDDGKEVETYSLTQPNVYARGILFGKMRLELGDHMIIQCKQTGFMADIEFITKGFIYGTYDAIKGTITDTKTGKTLFEISGKWNEKMYLKEPSHSKKTLFLDVEKTVSLKPKVRDLSEQGDFESRNLWKNVVHALGERDHELATDEKYKIESYQRDLAKQRVEKGVVFKPNLFKKNKHFTIDSNTGDQVEYIIDCDIADDEDPDTQIEKIMKLAPILPGQKVELFPDLVDPTESSEKADL